jgi:hypothetical protein
MIKHRRLSPHPPHKLPLLIRGFGVRVPGGAPVLTCCFYHLFALAGDRFPAMFALCLLVSPDLVGGSGQQAWPAPSDGCTQRDIGRTGGGPPLTQLANSSRRPLSHRRSRRRDHAPPRFVVAWLRLVPKDQPEAAGTYMARAQPGHRRSRVASDLCATRPASARSRRFAQPPCHGRATASRHSAKPPPTLRLGLIPSIEIR